MMMTSSTLCITAGRWADLDVCSEFTFSQIQTATGNFSEANTLGEGGFAVVYRGVSQTGQLWAVKRSKVMSNEFETEVRHLLQQGRCCNLLGIPNMRQVTASATFTWQLFKLCFLP